jgi:putative hydrolase of the HAD superfamily
MNYKHIFFDLDRTLWDFDSSAKMAFTNIFEKFSLKSFGIPGVDAFQTVYNEHNEKLWALYREGKIKKEILRGLRFNYTLAEFGINDEALAETIGQEYITISPHLVALYAGAHEILEYSRNKYHVHLITNGFSEVQAVKLEASKLKGYFETIVTSEAAGFKKPAKGIFDYAFREADAVPEDSLMIGDDPDVDILGAREVGMDQVLFDPHFRHQQNGSTFYINRLVELKEII